MDLDIEGGRGREETWRITTASRHKFNYRSIYRVIAHGVVDEGGRGDQGG